MNDETARSLTTPELLLPDDFARRVIVQARLEQRRQWLRHRVLAAAVVMVAVLPLVRSWERAPNLAHRSIAIAQTGEEARADQFTEDLPVAAPEQVSDYLMPDSAPFRTFAAYSD